MTNHSEFVMGVDLGDKTSEICVLNTATGVLKESRVAMTPEKVREHFQKLDRCKVVLEAGAQSRWFSEELEALGYEVVVTDPRQNALIAKSLSKTDRRDAAMLADIAASSPRLLHPVRHRGKKAQADLSVIRARDAVVRTRTMIKNSLKGIAKSFGVRLKVSNGGKVTGEIPEELRPALEPLVRQIAQTSQTIAEYDKTIEQTAEQAYPETKTMREVRGVGAITSLAFALIIEDPTRFKKSRMVGAYVGLRPRQFESGDIKKQLGITKAGDKLLRRLLVQCAHYILGRYGEDCDLRRFGEKIIRRGGKGAKKRAAAAVARKLAVLLHRLWVERKPYEPLRNSALAVA